jgi:hypothetical protein
MTTEITKQLSGTAEDYINDPLLEQLWSMKAVEHMKIHFNLISAIDPKILRLTPKDEEVYQAFRSSFPTLAISEIDLSSLKSEEAKKVWRPFCNQFEGVIEDFNYATLLRMDCKKDYSDENTVVVPRIQFLAIEVARNREGLNDAIREVYGKTVPSEDSDSKNQGS